MYAANLLTNDFEPLVISVSGSEALSVMGDNYVQHMPIVSNFKLLGIISVTDIMDRGLKKSIESYEHTLCNTRAKESDHIFDIIKLLVENKLTLIPVVDDDNNYLGVITLPKLLYYFSENISFEEKGSIVVLEMTKSDYILSEIVRILESEGANLLMSFISGSTDSSKILIHLKIDQTDILRIITALERHEFKIAAAFTANDIMGDFRDRYESLMHFLNI